MNALDTNRKELNKQQTVLRQYLTESDQYDEAIQFFLTHHAKLHSAKMAKMELWSFEDAIFEDMTEAQIRRIPDHCEHSIAWCIWHLARIEDTAMNLLVAGSSQIAHQNNWFKKLNVTFRDCGNEMSPESMIHLSETIDVEALRAYRIAVGRRTQEIVKGLSPEDLQTKVDPARLQRVMDEGVLREESSGIRDYWGKRTISGILLMPATRHNIVHLNEALNLKRRKQ